jgi:glycosyltransferase involved in cell wall biosynthesis
MTLENKRVIIVSGSLDLGGCERQALLLARHLRDQEGAEVRFIGLGGRGKGKVYDLCAEYGLPCTWARIFWASPDRWRRANALMALRRLLRPSKPDVLLPYTVYANIMCGLVWRFTQARSCIWSQRDDGLLLAGGRLERLAVNWTPAFMSNSQHAAGMLAQQYGLNADRVTVIRNGVQLGPVQHTMNEWREKLQVGPDAFLVCMVANLTEYKDHATLIRAWRIVLDAWREPNMPILLLAGQLAEKADSLKVLAFDLDVGRSVRFLGIVDDVGGLLHACDLGVFSSVKEGVPNGVLECMAVGLAVPATNIPGIREAVGPDGLPFLAAPGNAEDLAARILQLARNCGERLALGQSMQQRIETEFSPERMCRSMALLIAKSLRDGNSDSLYRELAR